jgi:predicted DNA-binding helix-hairpin-helix protein
MIVGATKDTDRTILRLSGGLYKKFNLKRVYFSAYIPVGTHPALPPRATAEAPLWREHRLYQSDWLMRFYSFSADEITEDGELLDMDVDPKCAWALRHPEFFPVEVNSADREELLRVPGVGMISADRIIEARRFGPLRAENLRKLGIVMKRARFFLTAGGKYEGESRHDHPYIRELLTDRYDNGQTSLFDGGAPLRLPGHTGINEKTLYPLSGGGAPLRLPGHAGINEKALYPLSDGEQQSVPSFLQTMNA